MHAHPGAHQRGSSRYRPPTGSLPDVRQRRAHMGPCHELFGGLHREQAACLCSRLMRTRPDRRRETSYDVTEAVRMRRSCRRRKMVVSPGLETAEWPGKDPSAWVNCDVLCGSDQGH
jgi:hypothetical protein